MHLDFETSQQQSTIIPLEPIERDWHGNIIYPEQRETDMGETNIHYGTISDLWNTFNTFLQERKDVYIAANLNVYYEEGNPRNYYTPDLMICFAVEKRLRQTYKLWEENVFPQIVFEIASDRTWKNDISDKHEVYTELGAEEYYLLDSERIYLPMPLMAYQREGERLKFVQPERGRVFSPRLGLEIVDTNSEFRLFDRERNTFLKTPQELDAENEQLELENEQLKARLVELEALLQNK